MVGQEHRAPRPSACALLEALMVEHLTAKAFIEASRPEVRAPLERIRAASKTWREAVLEVDIALESHRQSSAAAAPPANGEVRGVG